MFKISHEVILQIVANLKGPQSQLYNKTFFNWKHYVKTNKLSGHAMITDIKDCTDHLFNSQYNTRVKPVYTYSWINRQPVETRLLLKSFL